MTNNNLEIIITQAQQSLTTTRQRFHYRELNSSKHWLWNPAGLPLFEVSQLDSALEKQLSLMVRNKFTSYEELVWNWKEVDNLIQLIEKEANQKALQTVKDSLNAYQNMIKGFQTMHNQELQEKETENQKLVSKINEIEQQALAVKNSQETILKNQRLLDSQERVSLENLRFKYELLSKQAYSLEAKNKLTEEHNADLENSLEALENNYQVISQELRAMIARWKIVSADLVLARGEVAGLQTSEAGLKNLNQQWKDTYLTELYTSTKLAESILKLKTFSDDSEVEFNEIIQWLEKELKKTTISLELKEKNLKDIQRLNLESKIKLQGVLFLDTMRNVMPNVFSKTLTSIESVIFISGITNYPKVEKIGWSFLFLFFFSSLLYSSYQFTKFTIFKGIDFYRWLRGKKKDLTALKEQELEEWKNKWGVEKNYSFVDLNNVRKDKGVVELENNEQSAISNSSQ